MKDVNNITAITHIFKTPFFQLVLIVFLLISGALFVVEHALVFPVFHNLQKASLESEAAKTIKHLRDSLEIKDGIGTAALSKAMEEDLRAVMKDFDLYKVKIFDAAGVVIYSTDAKEIGDVNKHSYFWDQVAKGKIFSKIVAKNQTSLEGKIVPMSVVEVYIPTMRLGTFGGAFEVYYDITEVHGRILHNEFVFKVASFLTWGFIALVFLMLLIKASKTNIMKAAAEKKLTETNHWLERTVAEKTQEVKATQMVSVQALAILAEHYDPDTGGHLARIQLYVRSLLQHLAASDNPYRQYILQRSSYIDEIIFASLLHDIGKTAISVEILTKPGKLTAEEFETVKEHTTIAGEALGRANQIFKNEFGKDSYLALARDIARHHHEKWNGQGYPDKLKGNDIPLSARITAIADVYDALTGVRPYKEAWPHEKACEEILGGSGSHFDPDLVTAFKSCAEQFRTISETTIEYMPGTDPAPKK